MKVILKKTKTSAKFNVVFPKGVPLNYSKSLGCIEHPTTPNVWITVEEKEFDAVPEPKMVAKLVTITLVTRVLVEETATDEVIIAASNKGFKAQIDNNEVMENIVDIVDDKDLPFGTLDTDTDPIEYTDIISKVEFDEFKAILKELSPTEYADDEKDGFVSCYQYWCERGWKNFKDKHTQNIGRLKMKVQGL
ncbi:MAG: hypothetical protein V4580_17415 [Bacteroidota bacterium]